MPRITMDVKAVSDICYNKTLGPALNKKSDLDHLSALFAHEIDSNLTIGDFGLEDGNPLEGSNVVSVVLSYNNDDGLPVLAPFDRKYRVHAKIRTPAGTLTVIKDFAYDGLAKDERDAVEQLLAEAKETGKVIKLEGHDGSVVTIINGKHIVNYHVVCNELTANVDVDSKDQ